jgi:Cys-rich protein (TIGR01571 family)
MIPQNILISPQPILQVYQLPYNPYLVPSIPVNQMVIPQPNSIPASNLLPPQLGEKRWKTSLFDCFDDCSICLQGCICPCCLFGKIASKFNERSCLENCLCYLTCFQCCMHTAFRYSIRRKYLLPAEPCNDCCVGWFYGPCGLCQEAREIKTKFQGPTDVTMI